MSSRQLITFTLVALTLLLNGCASNVNLAKNLSEQASVSPEEGILVARVINTTGYRLPFNQLFFDPKDVNASKEIKTILAYSENKPIGDSTLFAVSLPPGEYSLSTIRSIIFRGEGYYTRGMPVAPEFGVFDVKAGAVTDLGTIIYYAKPSDGMYKDIAIRLPDSAKGEVLTEYFPKYATTQNNILTWQADERDEQRFAQYASAAQNPISYSSEIMAPDGSLYFLGKLGVLLRYSPDDGFETLAVDTDLQLNAFAQNDNGVRVVGGYESALFLQTDDADWQPLTLPKNATVQHISFYQENQFDVVYNTEEHVFVARYDVEDASMPTVLNTFRYLDGWEYSTDEVNPKAKPPKARNIKSVWITDAEGQKRLNISGYTKGQWNYFDSTDEKTFRFNEDSWEMSSASNDQEMTSVLNAGAVQLGIKEAGFWSWTGNPSYFIRPARTADWQEVSTSIYACGEGQVKRANNMCSDGEKNVKAKRDSFSFISRPWFWDETNGLAIVNFSSYDFWTSQTSSEKKIILTSDAGLTWEYSELTLPEAYCSGIVGDVKDRILLTCNGATSDFYESTDKAVTWQHIRQQQDF